MCSTAGDQVVIDSVTTISVSKLSKANLQSQVTRGTKAPKYTSTKYTSCEGRGRRTGWVPVAGTTHFLSAA